MDRNPHALPADGVETTILRDGPCAEGCVGIARTPGAADSHVVRDSKSEGKGREPRSTTAELDDFALGWVKERGLSA